MCMYIRGSEVGSQTYLKTFGDLLDFFWPGGRISNLFLQTFSTRASRSMSLKLVVLVVVLLVTH